MKHALLLLCSFAIAAAAQAQIIHVPGDYPTIQQGIIAAAPGDTVLVSEGIWYEQLNFLGKKPLTVASEFLIDGDTNHINATIIDGSQVTSLDTGSIVRFVSDEDTTSALCGFTIRNGTKGTRFSANGSVFRGGGAIFISGSGARIMYNHITQNSLSTSAGGGQIMLGAGIGNQWLVGTNWVVIDHNTIDNNTCHSNALQAGGAGISICCNSRITNNQITGNLITCTASAKPFSAGFFAGTDPNWNVDPTAYVMNNVITGNTAEGVSSGPTGVAGLFQCIRGVFTGNIVGYNSALSNYDLGTAAGIEYLGPRTGTILSNNTFTGNVTQGGAGALSIEYFTPNYHADSALVANNYFRNNSASNGGAIQISGNTARLWNNVFTGNTAEIWGGAVFMINFTAGDVGHMVVLSNNSFYRNKAGGNGGAIFSFKGKPIVTNSIFWADSSGVSAGPEIGVSTADDVLFGMPGSCDTLEIAYSNISPAKIRGPWIDATGNIDQDPLFRDPETLQTYAWSPCVDAGNFQYIAVDAGTIPAPAYDIMGKARPVGLQFDMGAYDTLYVSGIQRIPYDLFRVTNVPNPFEGSTVISYSISEPGVVSLEIFNNKGETVDVPVNAWQQTGTHEVVWNSGNLPSGMYFYRIEAGGEVGTGKMIKL
jgi:hypothetical protein